MAKFIKLKLNPDNKNNSDPKGLKDHKNPDKKQANQTRQASKNKKDNDLSSYTPIYLF